LNLKKSVMRKLHGSRWR